jgi:hypothetical protein
MRIATPATIVVVLLGMTALGALATLATGIASDVRQSRDYRLCRLLPRDDPPPVQADRPQGRPAAPQPAETTGAAEKMFLDGVANDFGEVARGSQLFHRFPIVNVSEAPIVIDHLQASCDCVTATAAKRTLQPQEGATIDVLLDTRRLAGPNMQTVRVKVVGPDFVSTCKLVVSAVIKKKSDCAKTDSGRPGSRDP